MIRDVDGTVLAVGDTVRIVKPSLCCGSDYEIGCYFIVVGFTPRPITYCSACGAAGSSANDFLTGGADEETLDASITRRVPPLSELTDTETREEIEA